MSIATAVAAILEPLAVLITKWIEEGVDNEEIRKRLEILPMWAMIPWTAFASGGPSAVAFSTGTQNEHAAPALQPVHPAYARTVSPFGPQKGHVGCKKEPGQTCFLKDYGGGVYLCKCFPTECGSAWSKAPGCQTITWKEPVIEPSVPQPFQSRPPARGRQQMTRASMAVGNPSSPPVGVRPPTRGQQLQRAALAVRNPNGRS